LTDNENPQNVMLGICEITAYQDNLGDGNSIIPYGSSTIAGNYKIHTGYDYHRNQLSAHPGASVSYTFHIQNESGSTHVIYFYIRWRYPGKPTAA